MAFLRKCPNCALEVTDATALQCPLCQTPLGFPAKKRVWIGALVQIALLTTFMLAVRMPKALIAVSVGMIVVVTALSTRIRSGPASFARSGREPAPSRPGLYRIAGFGAALCTLAIVSLLLFGTVTFLNSWNRWQQYQGQPFHRAEFVVERAYFQRYAKGASAYASGTVEGRREWMGLQPYLHALPRSQSELDQRVPAGTSIPVYLFPDLTGRARVQAWEAGPPAETARREALDSARHALLGLAIFAAALWLMRVAQRGCLRAPEPADRPFAPPT